MRDYIKITDNHNNQRDVEVITIFQLEGFKDNYIIYRELNNSHTYIAKYNGDKIVSLNANISPEELSLAELIYRGVKE